FMGPCEFALPGCGCGNAADAAVSNVTLPSTFCNVWWIWPLSTVTEPNFFKYDSAWALSSVPQPHSGYTDQSGMCANTTMGVLCFKCFTSSSSHSSCSCPSVPSPPAFKFITLTSPMKCAPFLSKLYQPAPLLPLL